jgi:hypothetical protein
MFEKVLKVLEAAHWLNKLWHFEKTAVVEKITEFVHGQRRILLYQLAKELELEYTDNSIHYKGKIITCGDTELIVTKASKVAKRNTDSV